MKRIPLERPDIEITRKSKRYRRPLIPNDRKDYFLILILVFYIFFCPKYDDRNIRTSYECFFVLLSDYNSVEIENLDDMGKINTLNYSKCSICTFIAKNYASNSGPEDVILTIMMKSYTNLVACVKSLRTTGSKATFFVFTDSETLSSVPQQVIDLANHCGCIFVNIGVFPSLSNKEFWGFRYLLYDKFLVSHYIFINRVLIIDLFDTIFQGDPFSKNTRDDKVYFSSEFQKIIKCYINYDWIKVLAPNNYSEYGEKTIINGGSLIGGALPIIRLLRVFFSMFDYKNLSSMLVDDQGYMNYILYSNILETHRINYAIDESGEIIVSLNKVLVWQRIPNDYTVGNFVMKDGFRHPPVVHQYKFDIACRESIIKHCYEPAFNMDLFLPNVDNYYLV